MIEKILHFVANTFSIPRSSLSYTLLSNGTYRTEQALRNVLLISRKERLTYVAKWQGANDSVQKEAEVLKSLNNLQLPCPQFIALTTIDNVAILIESAADGILLEELMLQGQDKKETCFHVSNLLQTVQEKTLQPSSLDALDKELEDVCTFATKHLVAQFNQNPINEIEKHLSQAIKKYFTPSPISSLVHFDTLTRNILVQNNSYCLFDFEFAKRSHFAVCNWLRFFMYSPGFYEKHGYIPSYIANITRPPFVATIIRDENDIKYLSALTYLLDFQIRMQVCQTKFFRSLCEELLEKLSVIFYPPSHLLTNNIATPIPSLHG